MIKPQDLFRSNWYFQIFYCHFEKVPMQFGRICYCHFVTLHPLLASCLILIASYCNNITFSDKTKKRNRIFDFYRAQRMWSGALWRPCCGGDTWPLWPHRKPQPLSSSNLYSVLWHKQWWHLYWKQFKTGLWYVICPFLEHRCNWSFLLTLKLSENSESTQWHLN